MPQPCPSGESQISRTAHQFQHYLESMPALLAGIDPTLRLDYRPCAGGFSHLYALCRSSSGWRRSLFGHAAIVSAKAGPLRCGRPLHPKPTRAHAIGAFAEKSLCPEGSSNTRAMSFICHLNRIAIRPIQSGIRSCVALLQSQGGSLSSTLQAKGNGPCQE